MNKNEIEPKAKESVIIVDIGGSGVRLGTFIDDELISVQRNQVTSIDDLIQSIETQAKQIHISGIGVSVPGYVQGDNGYVLSCGVAPYLEGNLKDLLAKHFPCAVVHVVNDGEAHALALLKNPNTKLGAINLAMGTAVGLGILDENGKAVRTLSGVNWEISALKVKTLTSKASVWWALGQNGLDELVNKHGKKGYEYFGCCLGSFASHLAMIFRPNTIGFSGGHIVQYWELIEKSIVSEFKAPRLTSPLLIPQAHSESALIGLCTLF